MIAEIARPWRCCGERERGMRLGSADEHTPVREQLLSETTVDPDQRRVYGSLTGSHTDWLADRGYPNGSHRELDGDSHSL
jgi:hypothetical protein